MRGYRCSACNRRGHNSQTCPWQFGAGKKRWRWGISVRPKTHAVLMQRASEESIAVSELVRRMLDWAGVP
jgi:hypothetical protein